MGQPQSVLVMCVQSFTHAAEHAIRILICTAIQVPYPIFECNDVIILYFCIIIGVRHVISCAAEAAKKADDKKDPKEKKRSAEAAAPEPPCFPDIAVCNAAGALHHLTFLDTGKQQFVANGGAPILTACLKVANPQTYENATGALWNVGLDVRNNLMLMVSGQAHMYMPCIGTNHPGISHWLDHGLSMICTNAYYLLLPAPL